jgi:hypothetical protein
VFSAVTVHVPALPLDVRTITAELDVENPPPTTNFVPLQLTAALPVV